jgi:uncharacterized protein (DUF1800 family)
MERMPTPAADVAHLLKRAGFAAPSAQVAQLSALSLDVIVDRLLDMSNSPGPLVVPEFDNAALSNWEKYTAFIQRWYDRMATTQMPIIEKMTVFWHNHFVSSADKSPDFLMWQQIALYRSHALGNLRQLTHAMAIDPAMLIYLDNRSNSKWGAQQNFARELMELFTMGVGNYTEAEVIEVARAWTGHGIIDDTNTYTFRPTWHDTGNKTIFGTTKNWDGPEVIDAIFTLPAKRLATARRIVTKLWTYFAHPNPPETVIAALANEFIAANFEIRPLLRALFLRPEFYSTTAKQGLVRSPVEWIVAVMKACRVTGLELHPEWYGRELGQQLTAPPNVNGWQSNAYWLGTSSMKARGDLATSLHWKLADLERHPLANIDALTPAAAVTQLLNYFDITVSSSTRTVLETFVTSSRSNKRAWNADAVLSLALLTPEFNLA